MTENLELRAAGFDGYDIYSWDSKNEKVKKISGEYGKNDKSSGKGRKANSLLRNFETLEEGTYKWDGSNWVKQ